MNCPPVLKFKGAFQGGVFLLSFTSCCLPPLSNSSVIPLRAGLEELGVFQQAFPAGQGHLPPLSLTPCNLRSQQQQIWRQPWSLGSARPGTAFWLYLLSGDSAPAVALPEAVSGALRPRKVPFLSLLATLKLATGRQRRMATICFFTQNWVVFLT